MREGPSETSSGNHGVEKIHSRKKTVMINDGVDRLDSRSSASGWTASDIEAEERQAISSYRSKRLEEASAYFQRKLAIEDDEEEVPVRSLRNVTGPLKEVMLTLFQGPNEVLALEFLKDCGVRNEATKTDLLSILKSEHLTTRDHQYIMECFTLMKEAGRRDSETSTDLPNDGSSSSGSSSDKRSDKRCSSHGNKRRRGSSDANSVSGGSSAVNSGRRGSSRGNSRKSVSFGKDPMWGGPPAGLNSSGKSSLTGNSVVEDLGSRRTYSTQFASDEDFRIFDEEDLYVDNGCSIGNTVGGSTILDFSTGLCDKIYNTSSGPKLQNLGEVYSKDASSDTNKNKISQILCRRSVKSRLPGFSNILELYASPVFQDPDLNVVSTYVEVQLSKQNDCSREDQLLAILVESLASDAQAAPTSSGDSMHGRLEVPLASSIDKVAPTLSCDIMIGTHEDPPASSIDKAAPTLSCDIMFGTYEDPPASSFKKPNSKTSNEIVGGRLDDPLASSYSEAVQIPSVEFTPGRPDDLLASSVGEVAPTPSGDIMAGRLYDPLISSSGVAAEARLPEHSKIPYEPGHWKDLPADIFKCPIRFFEAVEENLKDRVSGYLEEIEKLHEYKPVTTIAMLWQLRYLGIELADIRDNREDIDHILGSLGELSQLQNVAVKRLLDFLKVFDDQLMAVLKKAVDKTEDKLPPLWREVEQHGEKSYVTAYAALRFKETISSRIKKSFRVERGQFSGQELSAVKTSNLY